MTAHDLARRLLEQPDVDVMALDCEGYPNRVERVVARDGTVVLLREGQ